MAAYIKFDGVAGEARMQVIRNGAIFSLSTRGSSNREAQQPVRPGVAGM